MLRQVVFLSSGPGESVLVVGSGLLTCLQTCWYFVVARSKGVCATGMSTACAAWLLQRCCVDCTVMAILLHVPVDVVPDGQSYCSPCSSTRM